MKLQEQRVLGASLWLIGCSVARLVLTLTARAVVVATFGVETGQTDAFVAAYRLPQILGDHLVGGTLLLCVLPVLVEVRTRGASPGGSDREGGEAAWALFRWVLVAAAAGLGLLGLLYGLAAGPILSALVPELYRARPGLLVGLAHWLAPALGLLGLSMLGTAGLQSRRHFTVSALATLAVPTAVIASVGLLGERVGVVSWAWGLLAGLVVQVVVQFWALMQFGFGRRGAAAGGAGASPVGPALRKVARAAAPVALAVAVGQAAVLVQQYFGSRLPGALTYLYYAEGLVRLPLGLLLAPVAAALFPLLAQDWAAGRAALMRENVLQGLRVVVLVSTGILVLALVAAPGLIRFIFVRKAFTAENARLLSRVFLLYTAALLPLGANQLLSRALYATGAAVKVLTAAGVALAAACVLYGLLYRWVGLWGLAAGYGGVQWVTLGALAAGLARRHGPLGWRSLVPAARDALVAAAAAVSAGGALRWYLLRPWDTSVWSDLAAAAVAGGVFVLVAWLLRNAEVHLLVRRLREGVKG